MGLGLECVRYGAVGLGVAWWCLLSGVIGREVDMGGSVVEGFGELEMVCCCYWVDLGFRPMGMSGCLSISGWILAVLAVCSFGCCLENVVGFLFGSVCEGCLVLISSAELR